VIGITDTLSAAKARKQARLAAKRRARVWTQPKSKRLRAWRREREDRKYLAWIRRQPCCVCGRGLVQAHHEPRKALGGGGDWHDRKTLPLCSVCHLWGPRARHLFGSCELWEAAVRISAAAVMARLNSEYSKLTA